MDIREFPKKKSALRPEVPVLLSASDNELKFIKAMGIEHLSLVLKRDELKEDVFHMGMERLRKNGFKVTNAACMELQKNRAIHLGLENRDEEIKAFIDAVTTSLQKGEDVSLVGFGTFTVSERAARTGRNPQTGAEIKIPATKVPKFRAGKKLKDAVN